MPGQAVDLDHSEDRTHYLGFAHSICNRSAGAAKRNRPPEQGSPSRDW